MEDKVGIGVEEEQQVGAPVLDLGGAFNLPPGEEDVFLVEGLDEIPKVEEEQAEEPPEVKALREQNNMLQEQMQQLQQKVDPTLALQQGLHELGQQIRPQQVQAPRPPVDPELEKENFNDKFLEDPYGMLEKFQMQKLAPELQKMMQTNVGYAKQFLLLDSEKGKIYQKYPQEVEEVVKSFPPMKQFTDPNVYKEAADMVAARHLGETMEEMKARLREELLEELKQQGQSQGSKGQTQPQYSERGTTPSKAHSNAKVLPRDVWEYAGRKGLQGRGDAEAKARVYEMWKEGTLVVPTRTQVQ